MALGLALAFLAVIGGVVWWLIKSSAPEPPPEKYWATCFSPDGNTVVASTGQTGPQRPPKPGELVFWKIGDRRAKVVRQIGSIRSVAWAKNGKFIAIGDFAGMTKLVDPIDGKPLRIFSPPASQVNAVAISDDCQLVASATFDGTIDTWNADGKEQRLLLVQGEKFLSVAISPDGAFVVGATRSGKLYFFTMASSGEPVALEPFNGKPGSQRAEYVTFSHDGSMFASGSRTTLRLWKTAAKTVKEDIACAGEVNNIAFSPDDKTLATLYADGTLVLWDPQTGKMINSVTAHTGECFGLAYSPDGSRIATACRDDYTIKIWNAATLALEASLNRQPKPN